MGIPKGHPGGFSMRNCMLSISWCLEASCSKMKWSLSFEVLNISAALFSNSVPRWPRNFSSFGFRCSTHQMPQLYFVASCASVYISSVLSSWLLKSGQISFMPSINTCFGRSTCMLAKIHSNLTALLYSRKFIMRKSGFPFFASHRHK